MSRKKTPNVQRRSKRSVKEWQGVEIGMWADTVLEKHPNTEWLRDPDVRIDARTDPDAKVPDLIVTWHYPGADVTLERATAITMTGDVTVYAVQRIEVFDEK